jgi:hypothetical protein
LVGSFQTQRLKVVRRRLNPHKLTVEREVAIMDTLVDELAYRVARVIDRRTFLRKTARGAFFIATAAAVGSSIDLIGIDRVWADPAAQLCGECGVGLGCPTSGASCGPSRCCRYVTGLAAGCNCGASGPGCASNAGHCLGRDFRGWPESQNGCWNCQDDCLQCSIYLNLMDPDYDEIDPDLQSLLDGGADPSNLCCLHVATCCDCRTTGCSYGGCGGPGCSGTCTRCISMKRVIMSCPPPCPGGDGPGG